MPTSPKAGALQIDETTAKAADNLREELNIKIAPELLRDYTFLISDTFYIDVFAELLKMSEIPFSKKDFLKNREGSGPGDRIQELIAMLSKEILRADLSHIQGAQIAAGNKKHITNLLQILEALYLHFTQGGTRYDDEDQTRSHQIDRDINHNQSFDEEEQINKHTQGSYKQHNGGDTGVQKVQAGKSHGQIGNQQDHANLFDKMVNDGQFHNPSSIEGGRQVPTHNEDPLKYQNMALQPNYAFEPGKKTKKKGKKGKQVRAQSAVRHTGQVVYSYPSKEQIVDTIERNIYGPNTLKANKTVKLVKNHGNNKQLVGEYDKLVHQGDAMYFDDLIKQEGGPGLLDPNVASIRQYVDGKRKDDEIQETLTRQREQYMRQLQDMTAIAKRKLREKEIKSSKAQEANARAKAKALEIYQSNVQNELNFEEKAVQLKKRDQEIRYVRDV
jgi:Domain of unknown function (DUF5745)